MISTMSKIKCFFDLAIKSNDSLSAITNSVKQMGTRDSSRNALFSKALIRSLQSKGRLSVSGMSFMSANGSVSVDNMINNYDSKNHAKPNLDHVNTEFESEKNWTVSIKLHTHRMRTKLRPLNLVNYQNNHKQRQIVQHQSKWKENK